MTFKFSAATKLLSLTAIGALAICLGATQADAQTTKRKPAVANTAAGNGTAGNSAAHGPAGPNRSYQSGRTRVFVTTRSWLDAGVEVLPGDRKFNDYAFPPELGYPSFARENKNRPIDRGPMNPPSDMGGYPSRIPFPD